MDKTAISCSNKNTWLTHVAETILNSLEVINRKYVSFSFHFNKKHNFRESFLNVLFATLIKSVIIQLLKAYLGFNTIL